ncbi:probable pectinesterase/pectinesterase inhibitor 46 [Fagus crenata]
MSSFRAYGKVDEAQQSKLEALAAVLGTSHRSSENSQSGGHSQSLTTSIKAICDITLYPNTCYTSLAPLNNSTQIQPEGIFNLATQVALNELNTDNMTVAVENCHQVLSLALDHLNMTLSSSSLSLLEAADDFKTWLSSAGTYQETCKEGFENASATLKSSIDDWLQKSTELTSNSLAIISWIANVEGSLKLRRLMSFQGHYEDPDWLNPKDRKLLQSPDLRKQANIIVALDGSGKYKNISAALNAVPNKSSNRFVIYVKKGIYYENVQVNKNKWNIVMVGDGMNDSVVSATFAVFGKGFIAIDMGFQNTAGAIKHQAVALLSDSDQSIYYRCFVDAFQDTLYAHTNRQFYRECNITGTVDFIFGNSAVVFQDCNILPRVPLLGQQITITAQGKIDPNQNTGISIQNCTIFPFGNLSSVQTYLGRPWKNYSTTVYIGNSMGSFIDSNGWLPWVGTSAPDTIFYSEFQNYGPGSSTKDRVQWKGVKNITSHQASKFTVKSFIKGDKWIPAAGVPYKSSL